MHQLPDKTAMAIQKPESEILQGSQVGGRAAAGDKRHLVQDQPFVVPEKVCANHDDCAFREVKKL
jgi:hypothetical protein